MVAPTFCADDFGLSLAVNEAVEQAHSNGVLQTASLMVAGEAAADAVARARRLPTLRVGLHLVVIEGNAVLPHSRIPLLVDRAGWFDSHPFRRGLSYFFRPAVRRQLADEIEAQFAAFAATGLTPDHANAHKHMHLHPVVGRLMVAAARRHGVPRIRVPAEPPATLAACGSPATVGDHALFAWTALLRRQVRLAGLACHDQVFGLKWSGHFTPARLRTLLGTLPPGSSEIYFHPATWQDAPLRRLMPGYDHPGELAALCDPSVKAQLVALQGSAGSTAITGCPASLQPSTPSGYQ